MESAVYPLQAGWFKAVEAVGKCADACDELGKWGREPKKEDKTYLSVYTSRLCIYGVWAKLHPDPRTDAARPQALSIPMLRELLRHVHAHRVRVHPDKHPAELRADYTRVSQAFNAAHDDLRAVLHGLP